MDLSEWIDRQAELRPDKTALRFPGRDLSYRALSQSVTRFAAALSHAGVQSGDCVAYLGFNSPEMLALLFACARLDALYMPLNWRLAAPEHRQMLADCPPTVIFVEPPFVDAIDSARPAFPALTFVTIGPARPGWIDDSEFLAAAASDPTPRDPADNPPLLICYTSGSTGKPKGVLLTGEALFWNAANSADMHALTADDIVLTTLPLFHVGGLNNQTTPALQAGCTVVLHPKFDVDACFDAIEKERITLTVLVPAQLDMMLASPRWASADFSSLRMISTGSTIVPPRLIDAIHHRGVPFVQIYGATETCPIAACLKAEEAVAKAGSAGRAAAHCQLRIVDELGRDVAGDATGEIVVRGPNLMSGYWNNPEATAAVLRDGWFHTGDMGHLDVDGFLYVDGRRKEMIISGGENIYPAEIENVLIESPDIAEASVVGRSDARWGEIVVAVVVPRAGSALTAEQVLKLCDGRIARYKQPKEVVFVSQLPRTALGKIRKEDVRRLVGGAK